LGCRVAFSFWLLLLLLLLLLLPLSRLLLQQVPILLHRCRWWHTIMPGRVLLLLLL
jgi:hypothetical protein